MSHSYQPLSTDFSPAKDRSVVSGAIRPSRSYWQDAWARLKHNRRALISLWIILALLAFTVVGPSLWRVDPSAQDLTQISLGPSLGRKALLIHSEDLWQPEPNIQAFAVIGTATTEAVNLQWPAQPGATSYRLFRHQHPPSGPLDLGLPLATLDGQQTSYKDMLKLEAIGYYYSLLAQKSDTDLASETPLSTQTLTVNPQQAITVQQATDLGLLATDTAASGEIILPAHPLGTDYLGRDMLSRLMRGAQTSLFIGIIAPVVFMLFGTFYGGIAGFIGGSTDREMMRLADFVLALPFLLFMILFKIMFGIGPGESGVFPMLLALIILSWPTTARLVRGQVMQIRKLPYIEAAKLLGGQPVYIIYRHMLPNLLNVVLVSLTFAIPTAIFTEAFLSFIGMGVVPPTPSWGSMCNDGIRNMLSHPHELIFPASFISITVLAFNLLGDGLRDSLDIKMRSSQ